MAAPVSFIDTFIKTLLDIGAVQVLTLIMMITIVYAILAKSKLFGDPDASGQVGKRANSVSMILALILGFLVFLSPIGKTIDLWFTKFFIHILIVLATALGAFLLIGMTGHDFSGKLLGGLVKKPAFLTIPAVAIAFLIFINAGGFELFGLQGNENNVIGNNPIPGFFSGWTPEIVSQFLAAVVVLGIFIGSVALLFKGGGNSGGSQRP